jgi:hypothetical protein
VTPHLIRNLDPNNKDYFGADSPGHGSGGLTITLPKAKHIRVLVK